MITDRDKRYSGMTEKVGQTNGAARASGGAGGNGRSWRARVARAIRYRLIVPIKRSVHTPEHTARGVAVGLAWGLTPTIGVQMVLCFFTWLATRRLFSWDFSLIPALAWTWSTNVITMFPCYYLFYITGELMLGRFDGLSGYNEFMTGWQLNVGEEGPEGYWSWMWAYAVLLFRGWGVPMLIGCVPWAVVASWLGYRWTLRFARRHHAARARRRAERLAARSRVPAGQQP